MTDAAEELKKHLGRKREIKISVIGRKSGATITIPVWFVLEGDELYLLPVYGSDTQWFKNLKKNPSLRISAGGWVGSFDPVLVRDPKVVKEVVEKFRAKYGAADVKKYYTKFDVAVRIPLGRPASAAA